MKLINDTPFATGLLRTAHPRPDDPSIVSSLVVRVRHRIEREALATARPEDQATKLTRELPEGYGELPNDPVFPRTGTDVIVIGDAVPPQRTAQAYVHIQAGPYEVGFAIIGDRTWQSDGSRLTPTQPVPFDRMPVTYANAFGGAANVAHGALPNPHNPVGKGFYIEEKDALGRPLPNIEHTAHPITKWDDHPEPVGCAPYPTAWALRSSKLVHVEEVPDDVGVVAFDFRPENGMFDVAHPTLSGKRFHEGGVVIRGMSGPSPIAFQLPPCPVEAHIQIGRTAVVRSFELEEVLVNTLESTVDLTYRKTFHYVPQQYQTRRTTVRHVGAGATPW